MCRDEDFGQNLTIMKGTYKLVGRKELRIARCQDVKAHRHVEGDCIFNEIQRERINKYLLEINSKDPNYIYWR